MFGSLPCSDSPNQSTTSSLSSIPIFTRRSSLCFPIHTSLLSHSTPWSINHINFPTLAQVHFDCTINNAPLNHMALLGHHLVGTPVSNAHCWVSLLRLWHHYTATYASLEFALIVDRRKPPAYPFLFLTQLHLLISKIYIGQSCVNPKLPSMTPLYLDNQSSNTGWSRTEHWEKSLLLVSVVS